MSSPIIDDVLINLIGDGKSVPAQAEFANKFEFFERKNFPRRIIGRVDDDGLGVGTKSSRELVAVKLPIGRMQAHKARAGA